MFKGKKIFSKIRKKITYKNANLIFLSKINDVNIFNNLVKSVYDITFDICTYEYPNYKEWFWNKEIPRIKNNSGEIIICKIRNDIAGVSILKNDLKEKKLCTLYVVPKYRNKSIATLLLEKSFLYLGTTKPLASISSDKLKMFKGIIEKYDWKLTESLDGFYKADSKEYVFNGLMSNESKQK